MKIIVLNNKTGKCQPYLLKAIILLLLVSCSGADDITRELIDDLHGKPKRESDWGEFDLRIPNNIANTFTADPKTTRTITWQSAASSGEVILGNNYYPSISVKHGDIYHHRVNITGLIPGKTYRYIAGTLDRYSPVYSFRTENADYPDGFTIIHITDPQIGTSGKNSDARTWKRVIEAAISKCPDAAFVVNTGDIVDDIKENNIPYYFDYAQEILANYAFVYSLGNNDSLDWFNRYFYITGNMKSDSSGVLCSFDFGNAHFININFNFPDSNDPDDESDELLFLSAEQMEWLENDLKNTPKKWKVAMTHRSDFGKKSGANSKTDVTKLLDTYNVNLVLAGHYHFYMRSRPVNWEGTDKAYGTVWTIPNAAGTKFNKILALASRPYLAKREQPDLPMFTEFIFTSENIHLRAYTVDNDGNSFLFDTYTFY